MHNWRRTTLSKRRYAYGLMGFDEDGDHGGDELTSRQRAELAACRQSFVYFLKYYKFKNRETGQVTSFFDLWEGQVDFAVHMMSERWIFALKAGKLGFTELECAYDVWVARFGPPNARVHLFSLDAPASRALLEYVRFGLTHLPTWMQLPFHKEAAGGDTVNSIKLDAGPDDVRTIVSYSAGPHVSIDQTATHSHVDELARMLYPDRTWSAIQSTVAPDGSCHIVTRGADDDFVARLWEAAEAGEGKLFPFFAPWTARPREEMWREGEAGTLSQQQLLHFAPDNPADALAGDETAEYIPAQVWNACLDPELPPLMPGDKTPLVIGVDGAVTGDMFAVVAVSRHPQRHAEVAIRACKVWDPKKLGRAVDFDEVERFLRFLREGSCVAGHPPSMPMEGCENCTKKRFTVPRYRVVVVVYDPYQVEQMMQRLRRSTWCEPFPQARDREIADSLMHKLALRGQLAHDGNEQLRDHVLNARAKLSKDEDSKMRMIKRSPSGKIDLAVAASMAIKRCLELNL
jgi:hypothetical protein